MNRRSFASLTVAALGALALLAPGPADASVISATLGGTNADPQTFTDQMVGGVVPVAGWNNPTGFNFTNKPLNFSDGTASGATVTLANSAFENATTRTVIDTNDDNTRMFERGQTIKGGLTSGNPTPTTLSFASLPANLTSPGYDLIVYFDSKDNAPDSDLTLEFAIGTNKIFAKDDGGDANYTGAFVQATGATADAATFGNYVRFTSLTASDFTLSMQNATPTTASTVRVVTGFQIVPVPEPGSLALLGLEAC